MTIATGQNIDPDDFVANPAPFFSIEGSSSATHSLTTVANQKVRVIAKGTVSGDSGDMTVELKYNGVVKDTVVVRTGTSSYGAAFCLTYMEIPGAATQNVTVESSRTLANVKISVEKLLIG